MAQTTSSLEPHSPTLVIAMFALSSKITAPRALTATKPAKSQRRGLVVKVRGARRLVSRALFIHSTRRAEFVRRARAIAVSASLTRARTARRFRAASRICARPPRRARAATRAPWICSRSVPRETP